MLVVEDDDIVRSVITTVLADDGYRVLSATHGAAAMRLLDDPSLPEPECILLDMWMPIMDGREFIDAYRRRGGDVPIIALTGALFVTASMAAPEVEELVTKPFDIDELLALVRKHAGRRARALVPA